MYSMGDNANMFRVGNVRENEPSKRRSDRMEQLEELVQCAICLEMLSQPCTLPCQHTFCLHCLQGILVADNAGSVPKQKTSMNCPMCQLKVVLENGSDSLGLLPKNTHIHSLLSFLAEVKCDKCETLCTFDTESCHHCKKMFCKICSSQHMNEIQAELNALNVKLNISEAFFNLKLEQVEGRYEQINKSITEEFEQEMAKLSRKKSMALQHAENQKSAEKKVADIKLRSINKFKGAFTKISSPLSSEDVKSSAFGNFHRNTSTFLDEMSRFDEIRAIFDSEKFKLATECLSSEVDVSELLRGISSTKLDGTNLLEGQVSLSMYYKSKLCLIRPCKGNVSSGAIALCPWSKNILYITDLKNPNVCIFHIKKEKVIKILSYKDMKRPKGVVSCSERKEVYVTDRESHCIYVFSDEGDYRRTLCGKGSDEGKLMVPCGLAITSDKLIVCDNGNNRVLILNPSGGTQLLSIDSVRYPTSVVVTKAGLIVVADIFYGQIKMFNMNGDQILQFGSFLSHHDINVAVDPFDFIFVSHRSTIQIFNPDGSLIRTFDIKTPTIKGIAVTSQLNVVITTGSAVEPILVLLVA